MKNKSIDTPLQEVVRKQKLTEGFRYQRSFTKVKYNVGGPSLTRKNHKNECDINKIMESFAKTGSLTHVNNADPQFGDFSECSDYQTSIAAVRDAEDAFLKLPAKTRAKFKNDPQKLLDFISDESNYGEAIKLNLLDAEKAQIYLDKKDQLNNEILKREEQKIRDVIKNDDKIKKV